MKRKITLQDLADYLVQHEGASREEATAFVQAYFAVAEEGLLDDKFVKIKGMGTFKLVTVGERESVNINTGERFQISSHNKVSFTPDTTMKELVNRPFAHFETVDLSDDTQISELEEVDREEATEEEGANDETAVTDNTAVGEAEGHEEPSADNQSPDEPEQAEANAPTGTTADTEQATEETSNVSDGSAADTEKRETNSNEDVPLNVPAEVHHPSGAMTDGAQPGPDADPVVGQEEPAAPGEPSPARSAHDTPEAVPQAETAQAKADPNDQATQETHSDSENGAEQHIVENERVTSQQQPALAQNAQAAEQPQTDSPSQPEPRTADSQTQPHTDGTSSATAQDTKGSSAPIAPFNYVYTALPPRRRNYWKMTAIILGLIVLMALSYFAGYFRVLCPCNLPFVGHWFAVEQVAPPAGYSPATSVPAEQAQAPTTQTVTAPSQPVAQTAAPASQPEAVTSTDAGSSAPGVSPPTQSSPRAPVSPASSDTHAAKSSRSVAASTKPAPSSPQSASTTTTAKPVKPARPAYHIVKVGDNLYKISRRYYGDDSHVRALMRVNGLKDANTITKGMRLRLP